MDYEKEIRGFCTGIGLDTIGFCECRIFHELKDSLTFRKENKLENEFENHDIESRINPLMYMESGKTIISIAFPYLYEFDKHKSKDGLYFSKYTLGRDYHSVVSLYLQKICDFIRALGGRAIYFVDSNALPERYIAELSGVGFLGKNNMLITEKYGSYVFLGEIITDLEIDKDSKHNIYGGFGGCGGCRECSKCIESCPTCALKKNREENISNICMSYITQKKDIEDKYFNLFGGRIFGCDTCQDVCPFNENVQNSNLEEFKPYEFMENINEIEILNMDNDIFYNKYKNTSCGWRGKNILKRNVMINTLENRKMQKMDINNNKSPYIEVYFRRLLNYFNL